MTEKPKQKDEDAQREEGTNKFWSKVTEIFSNNPTLAVTASYVYLTAVGMAYSASLYSRFGINILDYSEIADFLLGAFKNPLVFLLAVSQTVVGIVLVIRWDVRYRADQRRKWARLATFVQTIIIIVYSVGIPYAFATSAAYFIKHRENAEVKVHYRSFKGSAGQVTLPRVELIGATQKATFFYDPDDKRTIVIPQAQIVSIEVPE